MPRGHSTQAGFTLLEVLVVVVMVGILAAIAAPSWLRFLANREVEAARDQMHQAIRQAQTQAMTRRATWQFSIRERNDRVEWAVHSQNVDFDDVSNWQTFSLKIVLDEANTQTFEQDDVYFIEFDHQGTVPDRSIITLENRNGSADKKCVLVTNLLGSTYDGKELSAPNRFGFECF